jgi:Domain of unknown function (DUF4432)
MPVAIHLQPDMFSPAERLLVEHGPWRASSFRFSSGVAALRITSDDCEVVMLPYQGQQIWRAQFRGRDLAMVSMFDQPHPTQDFLRTYGGFLIHCGVTAMGPPGPEDDHPPHGELPNAPFQSARLLVDDSVEGPTIGLSGDYRHTVGFRTNYTATPTVQLKGQGCIAVSLVVENHKRTAMELMYLAHINFRPVNGARLYQSGLTGPAHERIRRSIPAHVSAPPGYRDLVSALAADPAPHHEMTAGQVYDPEVVFSIDYLADPQGWATSLQRLPDGSADFVRHRPAQLPHGVRWISRTPDQDCLGLVLPATAETEGLSAERAKGNVLQLPGEASFRCDYEIGVLNWEAVDRVLASMQAVVAATADDSPRRPSQ